MSQIEINYHLNDIIMIGSEESITRLNFIIKQNYNFDNEMFLLLRGKFKYDERKFKIGRMPWPSGLRY
jgi:hypothetical protein